MNSLNAEELGQVPSGTATGRRFRQLRGVTGISVAALAVCMSLYHILYISGTLFRLHIYITHLPHLAAHVFFVLALVFLLIPPTKTAARDKLPWYDIVLALLAVAQPIYLFFMFDAVEESLARGILTPYQLGLTITTIVLILEATRRAVGITMPILALCFILYALFSNHFPGFLLGIGYNVWDLARYIGMWTDGIYGSLTSIAATIVIAFIIFAQFLVISGGTRFFTNLALSLLGHVRGGPAKVAVVSSALMGTMSGSTTANIATTGVITIPLMKKIGYKPHYAAAVEASASNGGQILPPVMGATAFIMADFLGVSYPVIAIAAILPAVLYFATTFVMVDLEAAKTGIRGLPRESLPSLKKTLLEGWQFIIPLAVLVYLIMVIRFSPQMSVLWAIVSLIVVCSFRKKTCLRLRDILGALESGAKMVLGVSTVLITAGIIVGVLNLTGLGVNLSSGLVEISGGNTLALLCLAAVTCMILGMEMTTAGAYLLLAILVAPALIRLGLEPIAVHMFVFYWGLSAIITPPVCVGTYVAAGIAEAPPLRTGWQAAALGVAHYIVPFVFIYDPSILMLGSPAQTTITFVTTLIGIIALAIVIEGYLIRPLKLWERLIFLGGAIVLIIPGWLTDVIGVGILALAVAQHMGRARAHHIQPTGDKRI